MDPFVIPILETERLWLRSFRASDFEDFAAMNADPEVMRFVGGPWDRGRAWRHLAYLLGYPQLGRPGMWAVEQKETGAFVGMVGFSEPEGWPGFELAGRLARRWWGHGYATEAARTALVYAFTILQKDRVISLVRPENRASIRVVERLGESLQGQTVALGTEYLVYGIDRESHGGHVELQAVLPVAPHPFGCDGVSRKEVAAEVLQTG
ncbi:MAG TPA: GNAT family N-acetyltransferase [Thermoanaerobaculia bacterium]|nr:GNAT family N-acetyltransferase [Thermoanaerobaculia bacterium]